MVYQLQCYNLGKVTKCLGKLNIYHNLGIEHTRILLTPNRIRMFNSDDHNQQVNTHRYLFHVSHPSHREGIQTYGILMSEFNNSERNGVYAHNTIKEPDYLWWPFLIIGDAEDGPIESDPLKFYDFWRIDTYAIPNNKWYLDNWARNDFNNYMGYDPKDLYVFTKSDIPVRAIELFRIQHDTCWDFKGVNGAYHFRNTGRFRRFRRFRRFNE